MKQTGDPDIHTGEIPGGSQYFFNEIERHDAGRPASGNISGRIGGELVSPTGAVPNQPYHKAGARFSISRYRRRRITSDHSSGDTAHGPQKAAASGYRLL